MVQSQFSLSWDSYKSNICSGFSALQQNGELVDMTIAADGHFVKVHQILVALASPYLKDLITSAPCQHPVIFLNNVTHRILCLLLEYMYTGEVVVPADCLISFAETAKALQIRGLETIGTANTLPVKPHVDDSDLCHVTVPKRIVAPSTDKQVEITVPINSPKMFVKRGPAMEIQPLTSTPAPKDDIHDYPDMMEDTNTQDSDELFRIVDNTSKNLSPGPEKTSSKLQFTVSIRGSLQVILNRYIYNLHSTTRSGLRRWRCVDYRNNKCSAYVTTKGNIVLNRANFHNHSFHDKKILSKIEKKAIYSAIEEVETYREKENEKDSNEKSTDEQEISMESDNFISIEFDNNMDGKASTAMQVKET